MVNSQSCPESLRSARSYHWEWCTINNELRTTSGRRVLGGHPRHECGAPTGISLASVAEPASRARSCGVSGATRGGVRNRSRIFATPRSGSRSTPAPSGGSGPILLIVDAAKIPGRSGSGVLVAPELVVELELLRIDAQRVRRLPLQPWHCARAVVAKQEGGIKKRKESAFVAPGTPTDR